MTVLTLLALTGLCSLAAAQPFLPGQGVTPLGTWRTSDQGGPYNVSLLSTQANEVAAGAAARADFTDMDIINFLTNVECLEGLFDTYGAFGVGFNDNLELGGPIPVGARKAGISPQFLPFMEEIALNEQGHALMVRQAGGMNPCPTVDFVGGFNQWYAAAYSLGSRTVQEVFGAPFDPFLNDATFFPSVLSLEELGATGNKGLAGILINPVHANAVAGLATSATAQATVLRTILYQIRNEIMPPFNETVQQVFARVSALRDSLDGPQLDDQGIINTDPRFIAVPDSWINMVPTDIRGLTFSRTPQQVINIVTLGSPVGRGCFLPDGLLGRINTPTGYNVSGNGLANFPALVASQAPASAAGVVPPPITGPTPTSVPGEFELTQGFSNQPLTSSSYLTHGHSTPASASAYLTTSGATAPGIASGGR